MATYNVTASTVRSLHGFATLLKIAFGTPAQNDQIVRDAVAALESLKLEGGKLVLLNGPASLPVAIALAHGVSHLYGAVACYDPKMAGYIVSVSHDPELAVGAVILATDVKES